MDRTAFWESRYAETTPADRSWTEGVPTATLAALDALGCTPEDSLVDVGGGSGTLVDALVARGWRDLCVVDLATSALAEVRGRVGDAVGLVVGDVTTVDLTRTYRVWHDRAVLHFLTDPTDRDRYLLQLARTVEPGGVALIEVFGPDGPSQCSGLDVVRYRADELVELVGEGWDAALAADVVHRTPWGAAQQFVQVGLRRR